jgi:hypothetical protein
MNHYQNIRQAVFTTALVLLCHLPTYAQTPAPKNSYGDATYAGLTENEFMKNWLILGPVMVTNKDQAITDQIQKDFFDQDPIKEIVINPKKGIQGLPINKVVYNWKPASSADGLLDFNQLLGATDYAVAYALAEIMAESPTSLLISMGSDDGVKVFVNGLLVHSNWIGRGTTQDEDIFKIDLRKGSNQILVKIQNMQGGWSFMMRKPGKDILNNLLVESAGKGNLDFVRLLIENGAEIDGRNRAGLTALQYASIQGRDKIIGYLKEKGANTEIPLPTLEKMADQLFKSTQTGFSPGVAILVAKNGEIALEKGYGYADVGNRTAVTPDTKFRIGSITKQFIAASILKLQEEGKISVNDYLSKFYPDFPRANEVTIHHLLTHTSGIHSYTNRTDVLKYIVLPITPEAIIDTIIKSPYDFDPGEQYRYNNSGFYILVCIIEKNQRKKPGRLSERKPVHTPGNEKYRYLPNKYSA